MTLNYLSDEDVTLKFSFTKSLQLWLPVVLSLYGLYTYSFPNLTIIFINLVLVFFTVCIGHCVGLHRQLIHESFKTNLLMKYFFLLLSSLSGIGGPRTWIKVHALRDHWQNQTKAPRALTYDNSLLHDFFINLHCRIFPNSNVHLNRLPSKLLKDPSIIFFEYLWMPLNIMIFITLVILVDLKHAIWLMSIRISISIIGHWLVGYIVHKWGYESHHIEGALEQGKNSLILGWITFGEAYHNNHHKFPESASMGLRKNEFDLAYWSILVLKKLNLASNIKISKHHYSKLNSKP